MPVHFFSFTQASEWDGNYLGFSKDMDGLEGVGDLTLLAKERLTLKALWSP